MRPPIINTVVFKRLFHGTLANAMGKVWQLAIQIITVPVMSYFWGLDGFGIWLMISAIPNYLAFSELGVGAAGAVEMTRLEELGKKPEANIIFNTTWVFLTSITVLLGFLAATVASLWYIFLPSESEAIFTQADIALAIILTIGSTLLYVQISVRRIVFQATQKYALGTSVQDILFMLTSLFTLGAVALGADLVAACLVQLISRIAALITFTMLQKKLEPTYKVRFRDFDKEKFRALLNPSMGAFALTLANSFGLQGIVLTIGWTLGPAAAAVFSTTRMLTRIPMQFSGLLTRASLPELTRAQTSGDTELTTRLMKLNIGLTLGVMLPAVLLLAWTGPHILAYISNGEMIQDYLSFILLGLAASFCAIWTTLGTRFIAINKQSHFSFLALGLYFASALVPFVSAGSLLPVLCAIVASDAIIAVRTLQRDVS